MRFRRVMIEGTISEAMATYNNTAWPAKPSSEGEAGADEIPCEQHHHDAERPSAEMAAPILP